MAVFFSVQGSECRVQKSLLFHKKSMSSRRRPVVIPGERSEGPEHCCAATSITTTTPSLRDTPSPAKGIFATNKKQPINNENYKKRCFFMLDPHTVNFIKLR